MTIKYFLAVCLFVSITFNAGATNGPVCNSFSTYTTTPLRCPFGVFTQGSKVYVANCEGLSISTNSGVTFTNKTIANGLGSNFVFGVYATGDTIYAATSEGLSVSINGGVTFVNKVIAYRNGQNAIMAVSGSNNIICVINLGNFYISSDWGNTFTNVSGTIIGGFANAVFVKDNYIYVATSEGLSVSINGGATFTSKLLNQNEPALSGIYVSGTTVYATSSYNLYVSSDGGSSFTNKNFYPNNSFSSILLNGAGLLPNSIYVAGNTIYLASREGLLISTNGGTSFTNYNTSNSNGLVSNNIFGCYASDKKIYLATYGGLSSCQDLRKKTSSVYTVFACDSFNWGLKQNKVYYSNNNTDTIILTNAAGVDSIVTINLTVKKSTQSYTNISICKSELPILWNGIRSNAGTYRYITLNSEGCDSVAVLNLTLEPNSTSISNVSICPNELPYMWNGIKTSSGTYTYKTTNTLGCDSTALLNLNVKSNTSSLSRISISPDKLPFNWNGIIFNKSDTQTVHLSNSEGCDSAATLILNVSEANYLDEFQGFKFDNFVIYPNPTNHLLNLKFNSNQKDFITLTISDLSGKELINQTINSIVGLNEEPINLDGITDGIYICTIKTNNSLIRKCKLIIFN